MDELKPCPFCCKSVANCDTIAEHEFTDTDSPHYYYDITHYNVVCNVNDGGCGASTGKCYDTPELAIEAWNRRADDGKAD